MTTLVWLFSGLSFCAGMFCAWHWQRWRYERVLKILGDKIRSEAKV